MKTIPQLQLTRALRLCGTFLPLLAGCFLVGFPTARAALPSVQPLVQPGTWPGWTRGGYALGVAVSGNYAYVTHETGLAVIDVSNPTNCLQVGGCDTSGYAFGVAVAGNHAYVADYGAGLVVIDVSSPTHCVQVGGYNTSGAARSVAVAGNYAYVADDEAGLQVIDVSNPTSASVSRKPSAARQTKRS